MRPLWLAPHLGPILIANIVVDLDGEAHTLTSLTAVKPIRAGTRDDVKIADFGIARALSSTRRTQSGVLKGKIPYMSIEQLRAEPLDARSDLYSLGVILYHCLTGRPPFTDDDAIIVMARHIKSQPKAMNDACPEAHVPVELEKAVMRAMSKSPEGRPANADAMAADLIRALEASCSSTSGVRPIRFQPPGVSTG